MTAVARIRAMPILAVAATLAACGQNNQYAAPPPPKVTVAAPVEQQVTRYFDATGNTASVNSVDSGGPGAGLRPGHQLQGRRLREKRHVAVHHRAGAIQAQSGLREGVCRQRPGDADAEPSGVPAPGRSDPEAGLDPGQLRQGACGARLLSGRPAIGASQRAAGRDQSRLYRCHRAIRRRGDGAPGVDRGACGRESRRRCSPPSCNSIRSG